MNLEVGSTPLVLLCPAWKKWGTAKTVKPNTVILHSRADDVIPFGDSEELVRNSNLPAYTLMEVGHDHRLADPESLDMMLEACADDDEPIESESERNILQKDWTGLCYTAVVQWAAVAEDHDWVVVHGTVWSETLGKRIEHAWCERGELVVDLALPVGSRIIERDRYYQAAKPDVSTVYSSDDALLLSVKNGHHGPWLDSEQLKK